MISVEQWRVAIGRYAHTRGYRGNNKLYTPHIRRRAQQVSGILLAIWLLLAWGIMELTTGLNLFIVSGKSSVQYNISRY